MNSKHEDLMTAIGCIYETLQTIGKAYATVHHLCPVCGSEMFIKRETKVTGSWECGDRSCKGTRLYVYTAE